MIAYCVCAALDGIGKPFVRNLLEPFTPRTPRSSCRQYRETFHVCCLARNIQAIVVPPVDAMSPARARLLWPRRICMTSTAPLRVPDLVKRHEDEIAKRSPSSSPEQRNRTLDSSRRRDNLPAPPQSPTPSSSSNTMSLPAVESVKSDGLLDASSPAASSPADSLSSSVVLDLEDIKEGETLKIETEDDVAITGEDEDKKQTEGAAATGSDSPLTKILERLPNLPPKEQDIVRKNIEKIAQYPRELPLSTAWSEAPPRRPAQGAERSAPSVLADLQSFIPLSSTFFRHFWRWQEQSRHDGRSVRRRSQASLYQRDGPISVWLAQGVQEGCKTQTRR